MKVYSVAKTVADGFKFRNQIGTKTAGEALRQAWKERTATTGRPSPFRADLSGLNVLRPYLEGMLN